MHSTEDTVYGSYLKFLSLGYLDMCSACKYLLITYHVSGTVEYSEQDGQDPYSQEGYDLARKAFTQLGQSIPHYSQIPYL